MHRIMRFILYRDCILVEKEKVFIKVLFLFVRSRGKAQIVNLNKQD